jgi:alpha-galactosidase
MLGDPRKLVPTDLKKYREYADWLQKMNNLYDIMSFRQDLSGFGEPKEGSWDGFQRINTDTKTGGIIGVFRHGSLESKRKVTINYLEPDKNYEIRTIVGKLISTASGKDLNTKGFEWEFANAYSGELFEVSIKK